MTSMQQMIERINARLTALEREARDRQGWLRQLMLAGPRSDSATEHTPPEEYARSAGPR